MIKLSSLKQYKFPVVVICMLAAGICYSCGGQYPVASEEETIIGLEYADESDLQDGDGTDSFGTGEEAGIKLDRAESGRNGTGEEALASDNGTWCYVHVCGEVAKPGVYKLPSGSRIYEAIDAAGGFSADGIKDYLNLAGEVQDGMKIQVPDKAQAELWQAKGVDILGGMDSGDQENNKPKVNINTASKEELMSLRGIGESKAEDIIRYREKFGGFKAAEDIMNVSGIKDAAFEKIKDSITV